jgi:hypothetical protein
MAEESFHSQAAVKEMEWEVTKSKVQTIFDHLYWLFRNLDPST